MELANRKKMDIKKQTVEISTKQSLILCILSSLINRQQLFIDLIPKIKLLNIARKRESIARSKEECKTLFEKIGISEPNHCANPKNSKVVYKIIKS